MRRKLASVLYNMNYELATYSCADQLVKSSAPTFIVGVAKRAKFQVLCSCFEHALFTSLSVVSWADSRWLKVYHDWYIQRYGYHIANTLLLC